MRRPSSPSTKSGILLLLLPLVSFSLDACASAMPGARATGAALGRAGCYWGRAGFAAQAGIRPSNRSAAIRARASLIGSHCGKGWAPPAFLGVRTMCSNVANGDSVSAGNTTEELEAQIKAKGDEIRAMKEEGAGKDKIAPLVQDLLSLKAEYSAVAGIPFGGEAAKKEPKKKSPPKKPKVQQSVAAVSLNLEKVIMSPHGPLPLQSMGDYETVASRQETGRIFTPISDLGVSVNAGEQVWIRGRVQSVRAKGGSAFVVLRGAKGATVQALKFKDKSGDDGAVEESKMLIKYIGSRSLESVVEIRGTLRSAEVRSCTQTNVEVEVDSLYTVSSAEPVLPFLVEDAARSEEAVESSQSTDRPFPRLGQELRLDNRWLDLRTPANNSIMRVQSEICHLFRESLRNAGFLEIHTPKLILGESEGGADVFRTDYFGQSACLAQSPQIYKQMAIAGDLDRVFEIGPVFRAENSNTRRHLCEFTGLDLEMSINEHYYEVLRVLHNVFKDIFTGLENNLSSELATIRSQFASEPVKFTDEPCILHWEEAMELLTAKGFDVGDGLNDLTGAQELALGEMVREQYGTDFFALDRYPSVVRPFYTMPCPDDARYSNSYDLFLRGQEICSGAQRCHDPEMLADIIKSKGIPLEPLSNYIECFRTGCSPHGGAGIGLERVVFLYLGLDNVRRASMFPRDPNRCTP